MISLTAKELSNEKTVGWFQGRMEFGPRALGWKVNISRSKIRKNAKRIKFKN